eukprot:6106005-Pyramimonas_sp.AAC.1
MQQTMLQTMPQTQLQTMPQTMLLMLPRLRLLLLLLLLFRPLLLLILLLLPSSPPPRRGPRSVAAQCAVQCVAAAAQWAARRGAPGARLRNVQRNVAPATARNYFYCALWRCAK